MKKINRLLALLLCIVMMTSVACLSVSAATLYPVGYWVYQKINNDTEFEIYDYTGAQTTLFTPYRNNNLPITTIGANAFDDNSTLQQITLSKMVTTVSHHAFLNSAALENVIFQEKSVTTIGEYAFAGCEKLSSIRLEDTLITTISTGTFMNCSSLSEITIPDTVTSIKTNAFANCGSLSKVIIPATVTTMEADIFYGSENVVIYCYEDSLAHRYAENNYIEYVLIKEKETFILGDSDNDGVVSVLDSTAIQFYLVSKYDDADGRLKIRADVDFDNVVSIMDATRIQKYKADLLGLENNIGKTFEY